MSCAPLYHGRDCAGKYGASGARPRSRSLKRSAIATIAALTGPVVIAGMIDASHDGEIVEAAHARGPVATTALVIRAHAAGADRMMMREGRLLQECALLGASCGTDGPGKYSSRRQSDNALAPPDRARLLQRLQIDVAVVFLRQIVGVDQRRGLGSALASVSAPRLRGWVKPNMRV